MFTTISLWELALRKSALNLASLVRLKMLSQLPLMSVHALPKLLALSTGKSQRLSRRLERERSQSRLMRSHPSSSPTSTPALSLLSPRLALSLQLMLARLTTVLALSS